MQPISVSQFNNYISSIIAAEDLLSNISIAGEVTCFNVRKNIAYFTIADENACLNCVCFFAPVFASLKVGMQIVVQGGANFYAKNGTLSFRVNRIEQAGKGAGYLEFLKLKEKLQAKGYFDEKNKKPIPKFAQKIGIVTSRSGAVISDICKIALRRNPFVELVLFDVAVQGTDAAREITNGIKQLDNKGLDVIIVGRGGGSEQDLMPFNDESVATAIFEASTPIISAVGHQTDITICDFVASLRAATPSEAAEIAVFDIMSLVARIKQSYYTFLNRFSLQIQLQQNKAIATFECVQDAIEQKVQQYDSQLKVYDAIIKSKNPIEILRLGYAVLDKRYDDIVVGNIVGIKTYKGELEATITKKENN